MVATVTSNLPDFNVQLRRMTRLVGTRAVRRAASSAGAILREFARREAPARTGSLRRAIYLGRLRRRNRDEVGYSVKVRSGPRPKKGEPPIKGAKPTAFYGQFVIKGHLVRQPGGRIRGGRNLAGLTRRRLRAAGAKVVPPNPFMERAFRAGGSSALAEFNRRMDVEIALVDAQV